MIPATVKGCTTIPFSYANDTQTHSPETGTENQLPENLYRFSAGVSCESVSIFFRCRNLVRTTEYTNTNKNLKGAGYNEIGHRRRTNGNKNENYYRKIS